MNASKVEFEYEGLNLLFDAGLRLKITWNILKPWTLKLTIYK